MTVHSLLLGGNVVIIIQRIVAPAQQHVYHGQMKNNLVFLGGILN